MNLPTQAQVYAGLRYAGTAAGTLGSAAALFGVMSQDQSATFVADLHAIIDDLVQLFGDVSKFALFIIPIATVWLAKVGYSSASPQNQVAQALKAEPKTLVAAVQSLPQAQVTVSDPKLAEGIPGVQVTPK